MEAIIEKTTARDRKVASDTLDEFHRINQRLKGNYGVVAIKIEDGGQLIKIPKRALLMLFEIIQTMAEGKSITLIPTDSELSTQQAADMLGVSRPHLVKLLEEKIIPHKKVGSHRRVSVVSLVEYEKKLQQNRDKQLSFLTEQAQLLDLGY
jgi:excisionase family DNA binding protein